MSLSGEVTLHQVIANLDRFDDINVVDRAAIEGMPFTISRYDANHYLVREGERPDFCCMLLDGYACRHKVTATGERQIVSLRVPGDMLDVQHLELEYADHNIQTITEATIAWVGKPEMLKLLDEHRTIRKAVWRSAQVEASVLREWVLNVGRRNAIARVAHLLCEFAVRREAAGLGLPAYFELPITQEQIADATGLTSVHVNRMLQALGARGVIRRDKRNVQITDWDGMRRVADFDPAYLHLER